MAFICRRYLNDGFGSSMGNYAVLYHIHKHTGHTPAVALDIPKVSLEYFNSWESEKLDHFDVFPNFNKIFVKLSNESYNAILWDHTHYEPTTNLDPNINYTFEWFTHRNMWANIQDEICKYLFAFDTKLIHMCKNLLPQTNTSTVGVSYRSEYFTHPHELHMVCDKQFYRKAFQLFDPKSVFVIFSDDINQAKVLFKDFESDFDVVYTTNMNSAKGMCMMSLCDHQRCPNSGFSFWASSLNQNPDKKVVCPINFLTVSNPLNGTWFLPEWKGI